MLRPDHPFLILSCGLTGTGKSSITAAIADKLGAAIWRSDVLRKEIAGIPADQNDEAAFGEGIYSEDYFEKTYKLLFEKGRQLLERGEHVILDASFKKQRYRQGARQLAEGAGALFLLIECTCSEEEAKRRLDRRSVEKNDVSDGRWEIYTKQRADFEAVDEIAEREYVVLDTNESLEGNINKVLKRLEALSQL
jgi:predicted kinase